MKEYSDTDLLDYLESLVVEQHQKGWKLTSKTPTKRLVSLIAGNGTYQTAREAIAAHKEMSEAELQRRREE